eukprot:13818091-Ditylum_brightwellii.AAC.1
MIFQSWQQEMADFMGLVAFPTALNAMLRDTYHFSPDSEDETHPLNQVHFRQNLNHSDIQTQEEQND